MCDMQKMTRDDVSCEEDEDDMNFAFTTAGGGGSGTHFVTTGGGQMQVAKLQQGVTNNAALSQMMGVVGGDGGVQYVRTLDGGAALTHTPQLITLPIALPGAKPGDPQPTVQIQVLNPNLLQQQQPKYQMQIPIQGLQGFQQGGAVLTVAYTPEANDGSLQLLGNGLPEGLQVLTLPPEMQLMQPAQAHLHGKEQQHHQHQQPTHQVFITQNQQIIVNNNSEQNKFNNNTTNNNNNNEQHIVIKEECDDMDDESSQGTEGSGGGVGGGMTWQTTSSSQDLVNYLNKLPQQQTQTLPVSLQQFLRLNPSDMHKQSDVKPLIEIEINPSDQSIIKKDETITDAILGEDGTVRIKKKKKYKKKPPKPAKPKPGQVLITTATDGTSIFCCPECQMAYSDKEQLEMHLSVHKIERRFICGICGAGLKRKEHLERHKLGHNPERPYVCAVCRKGFKRREHLNLHTVIHSGVKTELCLECGKGFYRKDHLRKHTRSHETKRARDESLMEGSGGGGGTATVTENKLGVTGDTAEITIVVPTSANVQVPVQINIPQHVVSSLQAQHQAQLASNNQMANNQQLSNNQNSLDALLAQHT